MFSICVDAETVRVQFCSVPLRRKDSETDCNLQRGRKRAWLPSVVVAAHRLQQSELFAAANVPFVV